jgi:hypothetical protein
MTSFQTPTRSFIFVPISPNVPIPPKISAKTFGDIAPYIYFEFLIINGPIQAKFFDIFSENVCSFQTI